jgi:hypothetical protein
MKTQITKRKLILPTRPAATSEAAPQGPGEPPPPAPDTLPPPPEMSVAAPPSNGIYIAGVVMALIALGCFIALVALQWIEYKEMKLAFPPPVVAGATP